MLAHLSEHCNEAALAEEVVGEALERLGFSGLLRVAPQERPLEPIEVGRLVGRGGATQLELL